MGDRERRGDGGPSRKRSFDQERGGQKDRGYHVDGVPLLHFRMLVAMKKAGSVIGKGGEFIQMTKNMTGAKVGVDKAVGVFDERLVHVQGPDEPNKSMAGIQEAVLRTAERIMGEEAAGGTIKLPHKCQLRMLLFKYQIGAVMGKKGSTINEIRNKSAASLKLLTPQNGVPIVPCAGADDELITIAGTPEQVLNAVKMISEKLRAVPAPSGAGGDRRDREVDRGDLKRSRGPEFRHADPGPPPPWEIPQDHRGPQAPGPGPPGMPAPGPGQAAPPGGAMAMALPPAARGVLANNDSVKIEGLAGLVTVEYRLLVPLRRSGVILGSKGGVIKDIRNRTGARVHLYDEEKNATERILQVMSTEDVQDQHCAAFDAAMDCIHTLLQDELATSDSGIGSVRIILPHGQVGAVMGKAGSTIKELRNVSGCSVHLSAYPDVPRCVKKGEEVLELRGPRDAVLLASHIALVAIRGNMGRGQLIYNYAAPPGAPPPTLRGPPGGALPPPHFGGPPGVGPGAPGPDPRLQHQLGGHPQQHHGMPPPQQGPPRGRSRWDSDAPPSAAPPAPTMQVLQAPQGLPVPGQLPPPPAGAPGAPIPQHVVYEHAPPPQAVQYGAPPPQQHVQPHQLPPPQQQQQPVQFVQQQGVPPHSVPVAAGQAPPPQQVVMFTNQPPPAGYAPQQVQVQHQQQPGQPEYASYVPQQLQQPPQQLQQPPQQQQPPPQQLVQALQHPPGSQPMVVYPGSTGQPQYVEQHHVQQQPQQVVAAVAPQPQQQPPTYVFAPAPAAAPAPTAGAPAAPHSSSGPASTGYGGLAGLVAAAAAPAPAPAPAAMPNARVLLTQDQVVRLRLDDPLQCKQLSALSGAVIVLSDKVAEHGAREVLLTGSDQACNTAKNLMEALMRSA